MKFNALIARLAHAAGQRMGDIAFNRIRNIETDGRRIVWKRRRGYAPIIIMSGNIYIRVFKLNIRILHDQDWLRREQESYSRLYGKEVAVSADGWLEMPWLGETLASLLVKPNCSGDEKLAALISATQDLHRIHAITVVENGIERRFSHGDAGVRNVAICQEDGKARWFDFEIIHASCPSDNWRHADDLRALLFSALDILPDHLRAGAVDAVFASYPDAAVLRALQQRIASGSLEFDTYHLAQTQMEPALHRRLSVLIGTRLIVGLPRI